MNKLPLERLYARLGYPRWFWPAVMVLLFVLWVAGSSVLPPLDITD